MKVYETELAIIGGGPAGLSAAVQAAEAGAKVLLIDENRRPGGQLFKQIHKFFGSREHKAGVRGFLIGSELLKRVQDLGVTVMLDTTAYGWFPGEGLGIIHEEKAAVVKAKKYIFAAGAKENYMAFPGSTLPGVIGAGAAQTMVNVNRVLPGKHVVMLGSGNVGLIVSYQLMQGGADVEALIEAAPRITGYCVHAGKIKRAGVPVYISTTIKRILGETEVTGVETIKLDEHFKEIPGTEQVIPCDTVCMAVGMNPMTELLWQTGAQFTYLKGFGGHVPLHDEHMETTVPGIYAAGDITGVEEASTAMEEGNLAGIAAAHALGHLSDEEAAAKEQAVWNRLNILRSGEFGQGRRALKEEQLKRDAEARCARASMEAGTEGAL